MAAPSFDVELHIETTTIMFADVVESVRLTEQNETENVLRIRCSNDVVLKRFVHKPSILFLIYELDDMAKMLRCTLTG